MKNTFQPIFWKKLRKLQIKTSAFDQHCHVGNLTTGAWGYSSEAKHLNCGINTRLKVVKNSNLSFITTEEESLYQIANRKNNPYCN